VLPPYRNQGYGRALVEHSLAQAGRQGNKRVEIAIIAQHTNLQSWYEQLGFTATHTKSYNHLPFDVTFLFINL
jgi:ribosomal protein S18 acetylase RimI-like enzyme